MKRYALIVAGMFLVASVFGCSGIRTLRPIGTPVSSSGGEYEPVATAPAAPCKITINKAAYKPCKPVSAIKPGVTVDQHGNVRKNITNVEFDRYFEINGQVVPGSAIEMTPDGSLIMKK